ncbi:MAG TPA: ABC transporter substrate-binding protein [Euzebya sp.]|nr:ABC transporter substrate-binding protein [Euzebya sp.]
MSMPIRTLGAMAALVLLMTACNGGDNPVVGDADSTTEEAAPADTAPSTEDAEATEDTEDTASPEATEADEPEGDAGGEVATGAGITEEPCPAAVNPDNGCIYLASMSDLTVGPFAAQGPQIVSAVNAFWQRVNTDGGIAGYDVDSTEYTRDHQYSPEVASQIYREISGDVLAIGHLLGSPIGVAIEPFLEQEDVLAVPGTWTSEWLFSPNILESGSTYCADAMNAVDRAIGEGDVTTVMAIHYPGDFGDDGAAGTRVAAEANGLEFIDVPTTPGADNQGEAISRLVNDDPDMVLMSISPGDLGAIVGTAAAQGYEGQIYAQAPAFNEGLLDSPVSDLLQERVVFALPWNTIASEAPGTQAFIEAMGAEANTTGFAGWVWSYPLLEVLRAAAESGDLTRAGLIAAAGTIESVDYEGILPEGAGNIAGDPNDAAVRSTTFAKLDASQEFLVTELETGYTGPTAESYDFQAACYA